MDRHRSEAYQRIRDRVAADLHSRAWNPWGARWRNRVGLTRMTAEAVAYESYSLLRDIDMNTHRSNPELKRLLEDARAAVGDYWGAVLRDNWDRLERTGKHAIEDPSDSERSTT